MTKYDIVIIGAGPAGLFSALKLSNNPKLKILLIDKGKKIKSRKCSQNSKTGCVKCQPCNLICGWGGSGAFSDGKLNFTHKIGGWLGEYLTPKDYDNLIKDSENLWLKFGAPKKVYGQNKKEVQKIIKKAKKADLEIITFPIRHMGSDGGREILENMYKYLKDKIKIKLNTQVKDIIVRNKKISGVVLDNGKKVYAQNVVIAPGRAGSDWLLTLAAKYKLEPQCNPVDLGVRVEIPSKIYTSIAKYLYELKVHYKTKTFRDNARTFCVCPRGEVTMEQLTGQFPVTTVNGQSLARIKTKNTNFAILVSTKFTFPFKDPIFYAKSIAKLANLLSGGVMVQRLKDLVLGQRSTKERIKRNLLKPSFRSANPGDLAFVLPYRYLKDILETLQALDRIIPGIWCNDTLLYGVEIKLYSSRIKVKNSLETKVKNLYVAGDGAGLTRGLVHASVSGLVVARSILKKIK
ncbi:FAD-dependent oxidoreductase [Candidatus Beckwithbacteria bacterium CG10_big_fil_rev_8_21_14_0_10_34_10]|uniref:FAD-dependent oxidoreductase n=1 Tax=Candidatus Beckwithbacteria bacterium CG10_big_fil_rev_8_21_14_0_10_34_10 TaxID=1974495 RepID=A0A2H0W847_9BACT|nr:MAG: FAD-dependent oxidoreductase [Candidatus Beckwithbacteria bacterium CG10_big_fil_rev_8_21_14_0_10_34_10]